MIRRSTLLKALGTFSLAGPAALKAISQAAGAANQAGSPRCDAFQARARTHHQPGDRLWRTFSSHVS